MKTTLSSGIRYVSFLVLLVAIYFGWLLLLNTVIWPQFLRNGEPITWGTDALVTERITTRNAYQQDVMECFKRVGLSAILTYVLFCYFATIKHMNSLSRICLAHALRRILRIIWLFYIAIAWMLHFRLRAQEIVILNHVFNISTLILFVLLFAVLCTGIHAILRNRKYRKKFHQQENTNRGPQKLVPQKVGFGFLSVIAILFPNPMTVFANIASYINQINWLISNSMSGEHVFVLTQPIDYFVSFTPALAMGLLFIAIHFAAPPSVGTNATLEHGNGFFSILQYSN